MKSVSTLYTPIRMFRSGAGVLVVLLLLAATSLSAQNFDFRAVHLVNGLEGIDVHFFELEQASIVNVNFGVGAKVATGLPSVSGALNVKYTATGAGISSAFATGSATVQSGYEYTGVAYGPSSSAKLKILERNKTQGPAAGKTLLRVLHAASISTPIDVHLGQVGSVPVLSAVAPDQVTPFLNVNGEATTLIITEAGKQNPLARLTAPLGAGTSIVTLIVTGSNAGNLSVYAMFDQDPERQQLILLEESSYTNVRVVHLRPNADGSGGGDKVDIYLNRAGQSDTKVSDTLKYRRASREFGPLFTDSFQVKFVPSGESPLSSLLTVNRRFANDTSYVVVFTQFQDKRTIPIVLTRSPVEPLPPGFGRTLVRFVNATDFYGELTAVVTAGIDTFRFESVPFRKGTEFRELPSGVPLSIEVYRAGMSTPFYSGTSSTIQVPAGAYLTIFALGDDGKFSVDMLNESQSGLQPLATFDAGGPGSVRQGNREEMIPLTSAPNPTGSNTYLRFSLERTRQVTVALYNTMGQEVLTLPAKRYESGEVSIPLELESLPAGHYVCLLLGDGERLGAAPLLLVR